MSDFVRSLARQMAHYHLEDELLAELHTVCRYATPELRIAGVLQAMHGYLTERLKHDAGDTAATIPTEIAGLIAQVDVGSR